MKKNLSLFFLGLFLFVLGSCSLSDFFIDDVKTHNDLVSKMSSVFQAESDFYDVYIVLFEGDDTTELRNKYNMFFSAVNDLDLFFVETKFASTQDLFKEQYNDYYRDFILEYVEYAGLFVNAMERDGVTFDNMDVYLDRLDQYTLNFLEIHQRLMDAINLQADGV